MLSCSRDTCNGKSSESTRSRTKPRCRGRCPRPSRPRVGRVSRIGDGLPEEHPLVSVEGIDDDVHEPVHLCPEFVLRRATHSAQLAAPTAPLAANPVVHPAGPPVASHWSSHGSAHWFVRQALRWSFRCTSSSGSDLMSTTGFSMLICR